MGIVKALIVLMLLGVSACASGGSPFAHMSDADFLRASPESQSAYISDLTQGTLALSAKRQAELSAGLPVQYGTEDTGHVLQCSEIPGEYNAVGVYPVHNPRGMATASHAAMLYLVADKKCNVLYIKDDKGLGAPIKLISNAVTTEDLLGAVMRSTVPAMLNGVGAAAITSAAQCGNDCGNIVLNNGSVSSSGSIAEANSGANVSVITSGQCGPNPCRPPTH